MISNGVVQCLHTRYGLGAHIWDIKDAEELTGFWKVRTNALIAIKSQHTNTLCVDVLLFDRHICNDFDVRQIQFILPVLPVDPGGSTLSHILPCCDGYCRWLGHRARVRSHILLHADIQLLGPQWRRHMLRQQSSWVDERYRQSRNRPHHPLASHSCSVEIKPEKGEEMGSHRNIWPGLLVSILTLLLRKETPLT